MNRHGYSHQHQAAYVVAADLREAMQFKSSTAEFLKGLEKAQVRSKGSASGAPLYTGMEVIQTGGGPQRMKVVYSVARLEKAQVRAKGAGEDAPVYTGMEGTESSPLYLRSGSPPCRCRGCYFLPHPCR